MSALIPEEYGGSGLSLTEATVIMEEVTRSGGNAGCCHGQMYNMNTLLRHGSPQQKKKYLPKIAAGELRLQAMGVTEPSAGTDTTKIKTVAVKKGDRYVVNGQKVWTSRLQHSELMILLAQDHAADEVAKKSDGMSVFLVDTKSKGLEVKPIRNMVNHETNQVFIDNLEIPAENLIGEEGKGFRYILDGLNAERILIAAECIGDGYWFIEKSTNYSKDRVVFDRPIGQNQGIQFPIAEAYMEIEAANLMRYKAAALFDQKKPCGAEANMAKHLARQGVVGSGQRLPADPRRLRLRRRVRRRAQIPREPPLPGGADLDQPDPVLPRRARARPAALVLAPGRALPARSPRHRPDAAGDLLLRLPRHAVEVPRRPLPGLRAGLAALRAADPGDDGDLPAAHGRCAWCAPPRPACSCCAA